MNLKKILLATTTATLISGVAIAADDGLVVFDWSGYEDEGFFQNYVIKHGGPPTYASSVKKKKPFKNCAQASEPTYPTPVANPCPNGMRPACWSHWTRHVSTFGLT